MTSIHDSSSRPSRSLGFSLIEVVLAIGIFLVTVMALVGLLGPTLKSVEEVESTDGVASVVNTVNAFLQNSPAIADSANNKSKFQTIYEAVGTEQSATLFVLRSYLSDGTEDTQLRIGFFGETVGKPANAEIKATDFPDTVGTIYRVVLTVSPVLPEASVDATGTPVSYRSANRDANTETYTLSATYSKYLEGYFPMEVRIYAEDAPGPSVVFNATKSLEDLAKEQPVFTYNLAITR